MARALYLLCAQSVSQDKDTGFVSVLELVDKIILTPLPTPEASGGRPPFLVQDRLPCVVVQWLLEPDKGDTFEDEFRSDMTIIAPDGNLLGLATTTFRFDGVNRLTRHRVTVRLNGPIPANKSGFLRFACSLVKVATGQTVATIDYPVEVEVIDPPPPPKSA